MRTLTQPLIMTYFLDEQFMRIVLCELERNDGEWKIASLILITDTLVMAKGD
jgi:stress response protein SCP2